MPDRLIETGLAPFTENDRLPEAGPDTVGANATEYVQEAPAASELPQLLVCVNGALIARFEIASATACVFVMVTVLAALALLTVWFEKLSDQGLRVKAETPVPVRLADRAGPTLGVTVSEPVRLPVFVGVKDRLKVQLPLAGMAARQVLLCAKSPLTPTVIPSGVVCLLLIVIVFAALVVPTA